MERNPDKRRGSCASMTNRPYTHKQAVEFVKSRFKKTSEPNIKVGEYDRNSQLTHPILRGTIGGKPVVIDVYDKIELNVNGSIKQRPLGEIVMRYLALKQQHKQQKYLIFTNFHMLVAFEKYLKGQDWKTDEVNVGITYFPVFSNKDGKISKQCTNEELSYGGILAGLKSGFLKFKNLDEDIQNNISYILKHLNLLPAKPKNALKKGEQ